MPADFWLEIGCEEIPARTMACALDELKDRFRQMLGQEKLGFEHVQTLGSARRFVVFVQGLAERQESRKELTLGPPARIAFNNGQPSSALQGFAKKNNVTVEALQKFSTERGDYMGFETVVEGASASEILSKTIPEIVRSLSFPKMMLWVDPAQRFSRPVRWLVAKHGERLLPIELFGVKSGNLSQGHRVLGSDKVEVTSFEDFERKLADNFVIVSQEERRKKIEMELQVEASKLGGSIIGDERLLEEVVYINEYPTVVRGQFEEHFLGLPREILVTVMKEHQKYFAVENDRGELFPHFLAVMNTASDPRGFIRKGHERVLRARLTDALFFWEVDHKHSLEERRARLKSIVFQEKLGTYADKVKRMMKLAKKVNSVTKSRVDAKVVEQAVHWSKSDLTTDMVREFTDLQGIVGGLYAKREGAAEDVWRAIYDQYRPQGLEDRSPQTKSGAVLSLADRLDTLIGCFSVGLIPTGSEDPLGLRRQMQGVIKILLDHQMPFSFEKAIGKPVPQLQTFYEDRLRFILGQRGFAYDEINAVVAVGCDDPANALERIKAIQKIRRSPDFEAISVAFKRVKNILRQAERWGETFEGALSPEVLEPAEQDLVTFLERIEPKIARLERRGKYLKILEMMAGGQPVIDKFFDKIMVMHEDPAIRKRRLVLLANLFKVFSRVADISEIVVQG